MKTETGSYMVSNENKSVKEMKNTNKQYTHIITHTVHGMVDVILIV